MTPEPAALTPKHCPSCTCFGRKFAISGAFEFQPLSRPAAAMIARLVRENRQLRAQLADRDATYPQRTAAAVVYKSKITISGDFAFDDPEAMAPPLGWADNRWLCTVGHGCVCGEDCQPTADL